MFGADLRTPFHHQRGGQPLLTEAPKRRPGPITASRGVELLVRVVLVPPAIGEPQAEPRAGHLLAELGPETPAGVAGASRHRALDVAQLGLYAGLAGPNDPSGQLHAIAIRPVRGRARLSRQG
jgi:hypothetical protein